MKQTTLFDFKIEKLNPKCIRSETDETTYPELERVIYKASKNDSDFINGFDVSLKNWIYPTNYPVREYQLQIVNQCLYKNTLVCLPTGLGKTFIATVVMFNFYRWYPTKKIVFVAPTKPLVRQQMLSASECVPINNDDVIEMTGSISQNIRLTLWKTKRVFFLTSQVFVNDLMSGACPINDVVMVVLDEAHKATGNHSYCQAIRILSSGTRLFRVLGLSATPGNDIKTIQDVIQNLLISHIELRTDECKDIKIYSHERFVEEVIVPLGNEVIRYRNRLYNICEPIIDRLKVAGAVRANTTVASGSQFGFLKQKEEYKASTQTVCFQVLTDFAVLICLYHAIDLVQQHGMRPLFHFLSNSLTNHSTMPHISEMMGNNDFMNLVKDLELKFQSDIFVGGHPKLEKLKDIVKNHFEKYVNSTEGDKQCNTRVMVFSQFRDSVTEILRLLEQLKPLVRPVAFVGRANHGSQKEQLAVMRQFISGTVNVLVSTCIGEEGLDVGEVDLIVCFDAQKSPIRLVQRLGRTGRKRAGRIVMLLSEGKEVNSYRSSLSKKSQIHSAIFEGYKHLTFYPDNPRLVPIGLEPVINFQKYKLERKLPPPSSSSSKRPMKSAVETIYITFESLGHMRFLKEENHGKETFSERYHVKKYRRSLYQSQRTNRISHSSVTEAVVSTLKLKEMHCRGKTNMIFHLTNSRILDIDEPMTQEEDEEDEDNVSKHSLDSFSIALSDSSDGSFDHNDLDGGVRRCLPQKTLEKMLRKEEYESASEDEMSLPSFSSVEDIQEALELSEKKITEENDLPDFDWSISSPIKEECGNKLMKAPISMTVSKKSALLSSFRFNDGKQSGLNSPTKRVFQTSTPIRKNNNRQSLLRSFHKIEGERSEIGLDTALEIVDMSGSVRCELSSDLFDDDYDEDALMIEKEEVQEKSDMEMKKKINVSAILGSFNVGISNKNEDKSSDEDLFPEDDEENLFSDDDVEEEDDDDEDSFQFSPLPDNICGEISQTQEISSKSERSNESECFLHTSRRKIESSGSPSFNSGSYSSFCGNKTDELDLSGSCLDGKENSFVDESFRFSPLPVNRFVEESQQQENRSDTSDNFLETKTVTGNRRKEIIIPPGSQSFVDDLDLLGINSPRQYQFHCNDGNQRKRRKKNNNMVESVKEFFLGEADVSGNDCGDDELEGSYLDRMEESFIDDNGEIDDNSQMHRVYMRSLDTGCVGGGHKRPMSGRDYYGEIDDTELPVDESYICDSFVVPDNYTSPIKTRTILTNGLKMNQESSKRFKRLKAVDDSLCLQ